MPSRVICLVCYRNLRGIYAHREAVATARRCLWDWEHPAVAQPASATEVAIAEGPSAMQAYSKGFWYRRALGQRTDEDRAIADSTIDMLGSEEDGGEPRPAS